MPQALKQRVDQVEGSFQVEEPDQGDRHGPAGSQGEDGGQREQRREQIAVRRRHGELRRQRAARHRWDQEHHAEKTRGVKEEQRRQRARQWHESQSRGDIPAGDEAVEQEAEHELEPEYLLRTHDSLRGRHAPWYMATETTVPKRPSASAITMKTEARLGPTSRSTIHPPPAANTSRLSPARSGQSKRPAPWEAK